MTVRGFLAKRRHAKNLRDLAQENASLREGLSARAPKIGLVSSDDFFGKVTDDFLVERAFLKQGINARRISWQDAEIFEAGFDALLITSMWGYQNDMDGFSEWMKKIEVASLPVFNEPKIIQSNLNKVRQFEILDREGIPHIETRVFEVWNEDEEKAVLSTFELPFVVKPSVSASGEGVKLIRSAADLRRFRLDFDRVIQTGKKLLLQPFCSEIRNGELGVVLIDGEVVNVVRRYPGIIEGEFRVLAEDISELPEEIRDICAKVLRIPEYKGALYARVDLVKTNGGYKVMEVEMFEPQLYYYLLHDEAREEMLSAMVNGVKKRISEEK